VPLLMLRRAWVPGRTSSMHKRTTSATELSLLLSHTTRRTRRDRGLRGHVARRVGVLSLDRGLNRRVGLNLNRWAGGHGGRGLVVVHTWARMSPFISLAYLTVVAVVPAVVVVAVVVAGSRVRALASVVALSLINI
jgi:hypothetical protein